MWSSVLNDDPDRSDQRTYHEAREVIKGTKYAANAWSELLFFHPSALILRIFFSPFERCSSSFLGTLIRRVLIMLCLFRSIPCLSLPQFTNTTFVMQIYGDGKFLLGI